MRSNQSSLEGGESIRRGTCLCDVDQRMEAVRAFYDTSKSRLNTAREIKQMCKTYSLLCSLKGHGINGSPFCPNEKLQEYTSRWRYHVQ